jgi:predicted membrane-bound spermidine synthase
MREWYVYAAVVVCGAAVLAIELLGTRVIAPFYGASLYLWSALISVTLAALSLGYALGGRWADRKLSLNFFSTVIGVAGLWIAIIPWLRFPVLAASETLGLRTAVLLTAMVLFFPPLTLLGMISPYAIRLQASSLGVVGRTAGNLYAISTLASVFSAVATGFFLIPNVGVSRLLFLIGITLILTALIGIVVRRKWKIVTVLAIITCLVLAFIFSPSEAAKPERGLIAIEESAYAEIRVVDLHDVRYLVIDGGTHTIVDPGTWASLFPYVHVMEITKSLFDTAGDVLVVGLGGGSVAKNFSKSGWDVDAVEIDPVVTKVAYAHFGLNPGEAHVYEMDARQYFITHDKKYDLIIMDAFGSSSIPFHLVTKEAFALINSRLAPEGVLAMNIEAVGWRDILVNSLCATLNQEFQYVTVLPIAEPPDQIGNLVLLASHRPHELKKELPPTLDRFSQEYDMNHAWDNRFQVKDAGIQVLTDDHNPVDVWAERINLVARRQLHEFFPEPGIAW